MPGGGVRAAREIKRCSPATGVIALTSAEDRATVVEMLDAGAIGYLVKGASAARILESIGLAASGRSSLSVEVTRDVIEELVQERGARRRSEEQLALRRRRIQRALSEAALLRLQPDFIKLDGTLVAGIENDRSQQALAAGLISFAEKIGAAIVAEGIENESELTALRALGVEHGQGYFLARPSDDLGLGRARTTA